MRNHTVEPNFIHAMSILSKRWNGLIIYLLLNGPLRPSKIQVSIGISGRVLSSRLKELEKQKNIERKVYPDYPIRVEYSLTEKGRSLEPVFKELERWSNQWGTLTKRVV